MNILRAESEISKNIWQLSFYRLKKASDKARFEKLLNSTIRISLFDVLQGQLEELIRSRYPGRNFNKKELRKLTKVSLGNHSLDEYGVWVYYPWSFRLVHILDKEEFIELRTNRNQYKITIEERAVLAKQKIGIIGLSVGKAIAITMALERVFGEIRLADFDVLELSNLNRIQSGIHNLGLSKVINAAREIKEIDPFLKVTCYAEGINEANLDDFLTKGGKLNILLDECDGLDMKILCRQKARELKIPVVMDTSDRGMIDVERFDLETDRPILHGLIDHLDVTKIKGLTNEEKIPYILPMVGMDKISTRLKASMLEVEQSISTWPQLASAVTMGGGMTTDVCRRIALNHFRSSGRYYVDLEELISDKEGLHDELAETNKNKLISDNEHMVEDKLKTTHLNGQINLKHSTVKQLVTAAVLAPSGGNAQPWKWKWDDKKLYLYRDLLRSDSFLDFENRGSFIGLGAATENLVLKAHAMNLEVRVEQFPSTSVKNLVSAFSFLDKSNVPRNVTLETHECDSLVEGITTRLTNRNIRKRRTINSSKLDTLRALARTIPGAELKIINNHRKIQELGEIIAKVERIRFMHEEGHRDFVNEVRWTPQEAKLKRDGIDLATVELTQLELAGLNMSKDWLVIKYLNEWKGGSGFERLSRKCVANASALGLITMPEYGKESFFNGGRAIQRVWLAANQQNISFQPLTSPVFLFIRLIHGNGKGLTRSIIEELSALRSQFIKLFAVQNEKQEIFLFRLCIAEKPKVRSLRRPVEEVLKLI